MRKLLLACAALCLLGSPPSHAQTTASAIAQTVGVCDPTPFVHHCVLPDANGAIPVTGTISASLSGFHPTAGNTAILTLSSPATSADVALPTGTDFSVTNSGASDARVRITVGAGTAVSTDPVLKAGATMGVHVTTETHISAITDSGTTALSIQGGVGLVAGYGGSSSSGGANAAASATGSAVPASASYNGVNVGGNLVGQTGTSGGNANTNVAQISGTAADANSGNKSAGTLRVVIATDQPALTSKLLVTPDSVALPANQSVNVAQVNGVATTMGNGASGTGVQRVTIANDSTGTIVATQGTAANLKAQVSVVSGGIASGGIASGAVASGAVASGAIATGALAAGAGVDGWDVTEGAKADSVCSTATGTCSITALIKFLNSQVAAMPNTGGCGSIIPISQTTSTDLHTSSGKTYICTIWIVVPDAEVISIVEGTGTLCATGIAAVAGGTTAANGLSFAANGGISSPSSAPQVNTQTSNDHLCLLQSGSGRIAGYISYNDH